MKIQIRSSAVHKFLTNCVFQVDFEMLKKAIKEENSLKSEKELEDLFDKLAMHVNDGFVFLQGRGGEDYETANTFDSQYIQIKNDKIKELKEAIEQINNIES